MGTKVKCFVRTFALFFFILRSAQFIHAQDNVLTMEKIIPGSTVFKIETNLGKKCLQVSGQKRPGDGHEASIQLSTCSDYDPTFFYKLEDAGNGYYYIKNDHSGKYLKATDNFDAPQAPPGGGYIIYIPTLVEGSLEDNLSPEDKLRFKFLPEDAGDGYYYIKYTGGPYTLGGGYLYDDGSKVMWERSIQKQDKFKFSFTANAADEATLTIVVQFPTRYFNVDNKNDKIEMSADQGDSGKIGFSLKAAKKITWWKKILIYDKNGAAVQLDSDGRIPTSDFGDSIKVDFWKPKWTFGFPPIQAYMVGTKYFKKEELKGLDVTFTWMND